MKYPRRLFLMMSAPLLIGLFFMAPKWLAIKEIERSLETYTFPPSFLRYTRPEDAISKILTPHSPLWRIENRDHKLCAIHPKPLPPGVTGLLCAVPYFIDSISMNDLSLIVTFTH